MRSIELSLFMPRTRVLRALALLGLAGAQSACGNIDPVSPHATITDPAQLFMGLRLDHRAINLSTAAGFNTIQLTVTSRDGSGAVMSGLPPATFLSTDTAAVHVTADGLVTAKQATAGDVMVIAEIVAPGPVRQADTAMVRVVDLAVPPELASLSIHPLAPDSAIWPMFTRAIEAFYALALSGYIPNRVVTRALDTNGNPIDALAINYESLDPNIVQIIDVQNGIAFTFRPGQARIVARTTAYGITKADTVTYTVTLPLADAVEIKRGLGDPTTFMPAEVRIAPHGMVFWYTSLGAATDIVFDDPTQVVSPPIAVCDAMSNDFQYGPDPHCGEGNVVVPGLTEGSQHFTTTQARQFPIPGVYPYHDPSTGATGRVVVTTDITTP